ncbi:zinc finger protein 710a isoform X2 [Brienomyrus brachyistius]|uniref:zinc finger protein 710a isoform X2 n=1 Tax=Brienomyrus brachyistius TaxID=42636 RepID=UPI0020B3D31B|nr:zinc finger protein 710a isoform X2 [Brienomyrus brachyistius]
MRELKGHSEEEKGQQVQCCAEAMGGQVDVATQTDPVVVLSLAQAAVLGLISQNDVFGATIAPNGFYTGEAKEGTGFECNEQLIGANGDYLVEEGSGPGTSRTKAGAELTGPADGVPKVVTQVKNEAVEDASPSCEHVPGGLVPREGVRLVDPSTYRVTPKEEPSGNCCPDCQREVRRQQVGEEPEVGQPEEEHTERGPKSPPKADEEADSPRTSHYFEAGEAGYEAATPGGLEEGGQGAAWAEAEDAEGQQARRPQMDRLDVNVQIDESYCVDVGEGLRRWKCRLCDKSYTSKYNLVTHILGHNGIKPHGCPHCGKLFKQPSHLQTHLLTHQGARPHRCAVCQRAFTQTSHLKRHMLQHSDIKPYSCRYCARGFAYPSELRAHEAKHGGGRRHSCPECGLELPSHAHLKRHRAAHQEAAAHQCPHCRRAFAYRSQLQSHLAKHQNARPFGCHECGMEFAQVHHLKQHALTHKGMKEFRCDVCSREFTLSANLKRHMLIHTSVRPYQCHVCFKTFVQKQTLKTHMIVHLPVKPFKCKVCAKSFNRMYNLLGHMHLHAGSKPFKCPYCSSKFNLKGNLSRHMKVKHGIMDASPEGQDPLPDMDVQDDYEEENFDFPERETLESHSGPAVSKLSEEHLREMDYYPFKSVILPVLSLPHGALPSITASQAGGSALV